MHAEVDLVDAISDLRRFVDLRNRIIHAYDSVDGMIVWNIVTHYVPRLITEIESLLGAPEKPLGAE